MTVQDIINKIERNDTWTWFSPEELAVIKSALEKQVAKKPINNECQICEEPIPRWDTRYCPDCGQKLDWEEGGTSE